MFLKLSADNTDNQEDNEDEKKKGILNLKMN